MNPGPRRRFRAPEVVQTSAMDCGPAALRALLGGFDIPVSYGRLREACQTGVDGTSIDVLEEVACQLGLDAEQIVVPVDHVLEPGAHALPAIIVVRLPNGFTHFVVAWRTLGPWVQVMDPGIGRRWLRKRRFLQDLYTLRMNVDASDWREWGASDEFVDPLRARMVELGLGRRAAQTRIDAALADPGAATLATLDAATRMCGTLKRAGALRDRGDMEALLDRLVAHATAPASNPLQIIPPHFWCAEPAASDAGTGEVVLQGAVLVRARGRVRAEPSAPAPSPELAQALAEPPPKPLRTLLGFLREDGLLTPAALLVAMVAAGLAVAFEALVLRSLIDVGALLSTHLQRLSAMGLLVAMATGLLAVELAIQGSLLRMGRRLEARIRTAFLRKVPRLGDRYFASRLRSDMADRAHSLPALRALPLLGAGFVRASFALAFTVAGIGWLAPDTLWIATIVALLSVLVPPALQPWLNERELRLRTHNAALGRFYLDAMLGLLPIRTHGAETSMRRGHEEILTEWVRSAFDLQRASVVVQALTAGSGIALSVWLLYGQLGQPGGAGPSLLLVYWALSLPAQGQQIALVTRQYPAQRNVALRVFEALDAPEAMQREDGEDGDHSPNAPALAAVGIEFENVDVVAGGQPILSGVRLGIQPGEHIAVVGPSGAGKSTLAGLLLGWHTPHRGRVRIDGQPLDDAALTRLRARCAWVDPEVTLWNGTLLQNLHYGARDGDLAAAIDEADLHQVLQRLPQGLQTQLGEGGGLVSGGEGQRVRLGRALMGCDIGLAILDEPFRGLDHGQRTRLLGAARRRFADATVLCATHDIAATRDFPRVLVVDDGRVVEDGAPDVLAQQTGSVYRRLLDAEDELRRNVWGQADWRRFHLADGQLHEEERVPDSSADAIAQEDDRVA